MASDARVEALLARRRFKRGEAIAPRPCQLCCGAGRGRLAIADGQGSLAAAALPGNPALSSFNDRFFVALATRNTRADTSEAAVDRFASATLELQWHGRQSQLSRHVDDQ